MIYILNLQSTLEERKRNSKMHRNNSPGRRKDLERDQRQRTGYRKYTGRYRGRGMISHTKYQHN